MDTALLCNVCGKSIASALNGLCPRCLLAEATAPTPIARGAETGGESFGDYETLGIMAEGGMGVVYYARQISLNRVVALKMIRSGQLATPSEVQRFRTEAEAAATLDHPRIVPIYEIGEHKGRHYFTMKLLDGGDLAERLARGKPSAREAAQLAATLARAVHHAHERGVLHRDIKPTNIVLDESGQPHLTDFGLAKVLRAGGQATQTQLVLGTPSYMAPEQAAGEQVTTAADIYSLGAVLYEMLAGRPPFKGDTALEILSQVRDLEPECLHKMFPGIDRDLEAICLKCLEKEPSRRYGSALMLAIDLEHWLIGKPIQARPTTVWIRTKKWARRNPAVASLAVMSMMLLVGGVGAVFLQWRRAESHATRAEANSAESRKRLGRLHVANGVRALEAGDNFGALVHFAEGFHLDAHRPDRHRSHELRLASVLRQSPRMLQMWFAEGPVRHAEFSRDGRLVLAVSSNAVTVWRADDGSLAFPVIQHEGRGELFARFSLFEDTIISAHGDSVHFWSARDGTRQRTFAHAGVERAAMSGDGEWVATAGAGIVNLWRSSEVAVAPIKIHSAENVVALEFSPDGKRLLIVAKDGSVHVRNLKEESASVQFKGGRDVRHAGFNFNATRIVTARSDGSAQVWNALTGEAVTPALKESTWLTHAAFSPDGKWVVASAGGHRATAWNAETGKKRCQFGGHENVVVSSSYSPSGERLVTASFDGTARIYEANSGRRIFPPLRHGGMVTAARFHPDGQRLLTASADGVVRLWSLWPAAQTVVPRGEENVALLGTANDGAHVLVQTPDQTFEVWDTTSWTPALPPLRVTNRLSRAWMSPDFKRLVTMTRRGDVRTNELTVELREGTGRVVQSRSFIRPVADTITVSPACSHFVLHGKSGVELFDLASGRQLSLPQPAQRVEAVRFSPDSRALLLVSGSEVQVVDVDSGRLRFAPIQHECPVRSETFSSDSSLFVTCTLDHLLQPRAAQVWDAMNGKPVGSPLRHGDGVFHASFSPDNTAIVTASEDGTGRLWEVATGRPLGPPLKHAVAVHHASFSRDGRWIATASLDKSARIWDGVSGEPLTPPLNHEWRVDQAVFLANGRYLLTLSGYVANFVWDLSVESRPPGDAIDMATVLSGHKLDETGALTPVSANELRELWSRLRGEYPGDFSFGGTANLKAVSPRDPRLRPTSLDLSRYYNATLAEAGNPAGTNASPVPSGVQNFGGVEFDVRGIIQLAGTQLREWGTRPFPEAVGGIEVGRALERLHILHGTSAFEQTGRRIASVRLHYADGEMRELPIVAGEDVGDWQTWRDAAGEPRPKPVWSGRQVPSRVWSRTLHWYQTTWDNPRPGERVAYIDYVSAMGAAGPYLIAVTVQP